MRPERAHKMVAKIQWTPAKYIVSVNFEQLLILNASTAQPDSGGHAVAAQRKASIPAALSTCGVASELPEKIAALKHPHGLFFQRRALHHLVVAPEAGVIPLSVYLALQVVEEQHIAPLPQPLALAHVEH